MRSITRCLISMAITAGCGTASVRAAGTEVPESVPLPVILKAREAVVVDGKLDETDWARAAEVPVDVIWGKGAERTTTPRMTARYLWDDFYLYIGYEVWDTNVGARSEGEPQGPEGNRRRACDIAPDTDVVEFFLVYDDTNCFWEIHHNASNHFSDVLCLVNLPAWKTSRPAMAGANIYFGKDEYIQDQGETTLARAVAMKRREDGTPSSVNDKSDEDLGYTGEIRLPWYGIGAPTSAQTWNEIPVPGDDGRRVRVQGPWKMVGREMSILAVSQDGDSAQRYCTSATGLGMTFFHLNTGKYPRYRLTSDADEALAKNHPPVTPRTPAD